MRGEHYAEWVENAKVLKREGRLDDAEVLLLECCAATEREAKKNAWPAPAPWYYWELAIIYRKRKEPEKEKAVLQRHIDAAGRAEANNNRGRKLLKRPEDMSSITKEA